jgi:hypothetical protein
MAEDRNIPANIPENQATKYANVEAMTSPIALLTDRTPA